MEDSWDWVEEELKKMQQETPVDSDMMQVVDAISVADFWKRRYDEELMLWERKLEIKEGEKKDLQQKAQTHEMAIRELDLKLKDLERRWQQEKLLLEDRVKTKEVEAVLEKTKAQWETRLKAIEEENKKLKVQLGFADGGLPVAGDGVVMSADYGVARGLMEKQLRELKEELKKTEEESRRRLEKLEAEKNAVSRDLEAKEKTFTAEKEQWRKVESEVGGMSSQMSQQLTNLKEREQEHFTILEDLGRGFAHRVRNYLGIMSGTVQLCLANYQMENELKEQLNVVDQNAQEMLKSIEEFLSLARIPEMSMESLSMPDVLEASLRSLDGKLKAQNIAVTRNFGANVPVFSCDRKLFTEAFTHIIQNSLEAMPQGGHITVSTFFDAVKGIIGISVGDTGSGVSEAHLKKIFQPYFSSKKGHKGLGITVAKRVIDLHRGTLTAESVKGKGTTITVNLLLDPAAQ